MSEYQRVEVTPQVAPAVAPGTETPAPAAPTSEPTPNPERPAWLPEKFKSPEDLAKAYAELEKKQGQQPPAKPAAETPKEGEEKPKEGEEKPAEEKPKGEEKPSPFAKFHAEFAESGELSEDSFKELEAMGISRDMVDAYIRGHELPVQQQLSEFHEAVGGKENYEAMAEWALQGGLNAAELAAYNKAVVGDPLQARWALEGLYARFTRENGSAPAMRIGGGGRPDSGVKPFGSTHEIEAAMSDPRYKAGDQAYHAEVQRRLAVSNF